MSDPVIDLGKVAQSYPALAAHLKNAVGQWGKDTGDGRQLEFYPPWESDNPNKGKTTLEFFNRSIPTEQIPEFAAADMLHYLGATNPETGQPVDAQWQSMRKAMASSRTPKQIEADQKDYTDSKETLPFDQYLENNRLDAYMRGAAFPSINPEWGEYLTPEQKTLGNQLQGYLRGNYSPTRPATSNPTQ